MQFMHIFKTSHLIVENLAQTRFRFPPPHPPLAFALPTLRLKKLNAYQLCPQFLVTGSLQGSLPLPGMPLRFGHKDVFLARLVRKYNWKRIRVVLEAFLLEVKPLKNQDPEGLAAKRGPAVIGGESKVKQTVRSQSEPSGRIGISWANIFLLILKFETKLWFNDYFVLSHCQLTVSPAIRKYLTFNEWKAASILKWNVDSWAKLRSGKFHYLVDKISSWPNKQAP